MKINASFSESSKKNLGVLVSLMIVAVFSRLIPHPWNFTAVGAVALFGGSYLQSKKLSLLLPLAVLFLSDLVLGFHSSMIYVYGAFLLTVVLGWGLQEKRSVGRVVGSSLVASSLFFMITNFGVWFSGGLYTLDFSGLVNCYMMAMPFFGNQIAGDLFFSAILFSAYEVLKRTVLMPVAANSR